MLLDRLLGTGAAPVGGREAGLNEGMAPLPCPKEMVFVAWPHLAVAQEDVAIVGQARGCVWRNVVSVSDRHVPVNIGLAPEFLIAPLAPPARRALPRLQPFLLPVHVPPRRDRASRQ